MEEQTAISMQRLCHSHTTAQRVQRDLGATISRPLSAGRRSVAVLCRRTVALHVPVWGYQNVLVVVQISGVDKNADMFSRRYLAIAVICRPGNDRSGLGNFRKET